MSRPLTIILKLKKRGFMNKYGLLLFFVIVVLDMHAQPLTRKYILKGSSELTGLFMTDNHDNGTNSVKIETSQINFQPSIGAFISHHVLLSMYIGLQYQKETESEENTYNKSYVFSIGPDVRFYLGSSKFIPFIDGSLGYASTRLEQKDNLGDISDVNLNGFEYRIGFGIEYFIERKFSFEFMINYSGAELNEVSNTQDYFGSDEYNITRKGFGFRIGTSIFLN